MRNGHGDFFPVRVDPALRRLLDRLRDERHLSVSTWIQDTIRKSVECKLGPEPTRPPSGTHPSCRQGPARLPGGPSRSPRGNRYPIPQPQSNSKPPKPSAGLTLALCAIASISVILLRRSLASPPSQLPPGLPAIRTAVAGVGKLSKSLRVSGTIEALRSVPVQSPSLRGPPDFGLDTLTIVRLADVGSVVNVGGVVAELELEQLETHIEDQRSHLAMLDSALKKRRAEILILQDTSAHE